MNDETGVTGSETSRAAESGLADADGFSGAADDAGVSALFPLTARLVLRNWMEILTSARVCRFQADGSSRTQFQFAHAIHEFPWSGRRTRSLERQPHRGRPDQSHQKDQRLAIFMDADSARRSGWILCGRRGSIPPPTLVMAALTSMLGFQNQHVTVSLANQITFYETIDRHGMYDFTPEISQTIWKNGLKISVPFATSLDCRRLRNSH